MKARLRRTVRISIFVILYFDVIVAIDVRINYLYSTFIVMYSLVRFYVHCDVPVNGGNFGQSGNFGH